jgi:hypothetical protein
MSHLRAQILSDMGTFIEASGGSELQLKKRVLAATPSRTVNFAISEKVIIYSLPPTSGGGRSRS